MSSRSLEALQSQVLRLRWVVDRFGALVLPVAKELV